MKIMPLHNRILIKRVGEEEKTKGGIIIPDMTKVTVWPFRMLRA